MKYPCDTIKDLLPLYYDDVCSDSTRKIVEDHLAECPSCRKMMQNIENQTYDTHLQEERGHVVEHYSQKVKRKSLVVGLCMAAVMAVPILACLIVNLVTGHALDWFFIVLTALMVFASVTVVPLVVEEKKGLWTLGGFTVSLLLLLLTCCLYNGGTWFFAAAVPVIFGLSVIFLPYVAYSIPLNGFPSRHKGLMVMAIDTVLLYSVVVVCGLYNHAISNWGEAFFDTTVSILFPWALFASIRYLKANGFIKAGICTIISSIFISLFNDMINWIHEGTLHITLTNARLGYWNSDALINANSYLLILLTGCTIGIVLLMAGVIQKRRK